MKPRIDAGRIVVIGGGCYGSWYTQQLARAIDRDALCVEEIVVVDHDADCRVAQRRRDGAYGQAPVRVECTTWREYLSVWLARGTEALARDLMVPSPLMPHLCLEWLMERAETRWPDRVLSVQPLPSAPPMPWQRAAPDGRHYVSYATWTCPVNCIEPARCPATRGARDWSMPPVLRDFASTAGLDASLIFHCEHRTYGVGMIDAHAIAQADEWMASCTDRESVRVLVGTVSHCHGALGLLTMSSASNQS